MCPRERTKTEGQSKSQQATHRKEELTASFALPFIRQQFTRLAYWTDHAYLPLRTAMFKKKSPASSPAASPALAAQAPAPSPAKPEEKKV